MNILILKEALKHYAQSADCPAKDRNAVLEAIGECQTTIDRVQAVNEPDDFTYTVSVVPSLTLSDILNLTTYDDYGKLAKAHGGRCPFSYYVHAVYRGTCLDALTAEQLRLGYDYIADLWSDNEASGEHNPDGTFKRMDDTLTIGRNLLRRVIRRLDDKLMIDREFMEADDVEALLEEISKLKEINERR